MADYQQDRIPPPRPNQYPPPNGNHQRDAAFSNIFGAAPPGRSQTMTSSVPPPSMMPEGRTQTMSSSMSGMQRQPPPRSPPGGYNDQPMPRPRPSDGGMGNGGYYQGP